jgi:hypothetical protein
VRRSVDNTLSGEIITGPDQTNTMADVKPVVTIDEDATSTDRKKKRWDIRAVKWLEKDVQGFWCIRGRQQRGKWLLQLLVLVQFSFVGGVDIYTLLWASAGFVHRAAAASLAVSILASGINMFNSLRFREAYDVFMLYLLVGIVWASIEIILKAFSLHVLNAADSGDGATCTILVLFYLDLTAFGILKLCTILYFGLIIYLNTLDEDQEKKGSKEIKNEPTPDEEK